MADGQGVWKHGKPEATKEVRRCVGITDCAKSGAGSREKVLEVRIVELHLVAVGEKSDLNTNFPDAELPGISKNVPRDRPGTLGRVFRA